MSAAPADTPVVILAGGRGARFDHESQVRPKPLIEVAGKPMLGHIMDLYEAQGFTDFIILGGYLCEQISDYVATRYDSRASVPNYDYITVFGDRGGVVKTHVFDTGLDTTTGGRLMELEVDFMPRKAPYFLTYGDGLADVDLHALMAHHNEMKRRKDDRMNVTITAVQPPGRFGVLRFADDAYHQVEQESFVQGFEEKSTSDWINGGFMVVDRGVVPTYVPHGFSPEHDDAPLQSFEEGALTRLAKAHRLNAYRHTGYWRCMDTRRDLEQIEEDVRRVGGRLPWLRYNGEQDGNQARDPE